MVLQLVHERAPILVTHLDHACVEAFVLSCNANLLCGAHEAFAEITTGSIQDHLLSLVVRVAVAQHCQDQGRALLLILN